MSEEGGEGQGNDALISLLFPFESCTPPFEYSTIFTLCIDSTEIMSVMILIYSRLRV